MKAKANFVQFKFFGQLPTFFFFFFLPKPNDYNLEVLLEEHWLQVANKMSVGRLAQRAPVME